MMPADAGLGPPENGEGRTPTDPADAQRIGSHQTTTHGNGSHRAPVCCGGRAHFGRDGFRRGAVDALRVACREIPDPDVWAVLHRIAERYELAGGD